MLRTAVVPAEPDKTLAVSTPQALPALKRKASREGAKGRTPPEYDTALRTLAVLQTTLQLEPLLRLFSREVGQTVSHSSIQYYKKGQHGTELRVGRAARYRRSFRLVVERQEIGRLCFSRATPFSEEETAMLELLASSVAYPLRNALQYEHAFIASVTDPLTGVYNRNMLQHALHREVGLSRRHRTPLSLILLDIDGLKAVNDRHGHATGDKLIRAIAHCVAQSLRETDMLSRFGGDEFAILLTNTDLRGASVLAKNIRRRVEKTVSQSVDDAVKASVSIGIASLSRHDDHMGLFARADKALYRAKRAGRNCVKVAGVR